LEEAPQLVQHALNDISAARIARAPSGNAHRRHHPRCPAARRPFGRRAGALAAGVRRSRPAAMASRSRPRTASDRGHDRPGARPNADAAALSWKIEIPGWRGAPRV
jgi:hypothetical protein